MNRAKRRPAKRGPHGKRDLLRKASSMLAKKLTKDPKPKAKASSKAKAKTKAKAKAKVITVPTGSSASRRNGRG